MSAIATFHIVPADFRTRLNAVHTSADFERILGSSETESFDYGASGYLLATLLPVLAAEYDLDLMDGDPDLASKVMELSGGTAFAFTQQERESFLDRLQPALFEPGTLEGAYLAFNETDDDGLAPALLDGIAFLRSGLEKLRENTLALLTID